MECQERLIAEPPSTRWPVWQSAYTLSCAAMLVMAWDASWTVVAPVAACLGLGVVLVWHSLRAMTLEHAFRAEWLRAQAEWEGLRRGAVAARSQGQALDEYLRLAGYRVPGVVRAIAHDLATEFASE